MEEDELPLPRGGGQVARQPGTLRGVGGRVRVEDDEVGVAVVEGIVALLVGAVAGQGEHLDLDRARPVGGADVVQVMVAERREERDPPHRVHVVGERIAVPVGLRAVLVGVVADRHDHLGVGRVLEVGDGLLMAAGLAPVADDREEQVGRIGRALEGREVGSRRARGLHGDAVDLQLVVVARAGKEAAQADDVTRPGRADLAAARLRHRLAEAEDRRGPVLHRAVAGGVRPPGDRHGSGERVRVLDDGSAGDRDRPGPTRDHESCGDEKKGLRSHQAVSLEKPVAGVDGSAPLGCAGARPYTTDRWRGKEKSLKGVDTAPAGARALPASDVVSASMSVTCMTQLASNPCAA